MKTGKKVLGAVLAAAMALSSITPVFAAEKILILKFRTILFMRNLLITIN